MHIYYGESGLILTELTKVSFDTGLSRVDCIYRCRTTSADALEPSLAKGQPIPDRTAFLIKENALRKDETDGFTTFRVAGFYGTLQTTTNGTASIPSVLGIARTNISLRTIRKTSTGTTVVNLINDYPLEILSDTITQTFTISTSASCLDLVAPTQVLNLKIQTDVGGIENLLSLGYSYTEPNINTTYVYRSLYVNGTIGNRVSGSKVLINVNRSNFGIYDEITATWGLKIENITISPSYSLVSTQVSS